MENPLRRVQLASKVWRAARWRAQITSVEGELERIREWIELRELRRALEQARAGRDVCWLEPHDEEEPLITVRIATYRRADLLREFGLASALRQTYDRLEILVIGDCTDAETDRLMAGVRDPRVRYVNLPHPTLYPKAPPKARHAVEGSLPMTVGALLARGSWIAPCDDDDEITDDHVEVLLREAKSRRLELVHSNTDREIAPNVWEQLGRSPIAVGQVTAGSVMYSLGLRFVPYSLTCWKLPEPQDWNLWRRLRDMGVVIGHLDQVTYRYYLPDHHRSKEHRPS